MSKQNALLEAIDKGNLIAQCIREKRYKILPIQVLQENLFGNENFKAKTGLAICGFEVCDDVEKAGTDEWPRRVILCAQSDLNDWNKSFENIYKDWGSSNLFVKWYDCLGELK